jgi:hypothetical protein
MPSPGVNRDWLIGFVIGPNRSPCGSAGGVLGPDPVPSDASWGPRAAVSRSWSRDTRELARTAMRGVNAPRALTALGERVSSPTRSA